LVLIVRRRKLLWSQSPFSSGQGWGEGGSHFLLLEPFSDRHYSVFPSFVNFCKHRILSARRKCLSVKELLRAENFAPCKTENCPESEKISQVQAAQRVGEFRGTNGCGAEKRARRKNLSPASRHPLDGMVSASGRHRP